MASVNGVEVSWPTGVDRRVVMFGISTRCIKHELGAGCSMGEEGVA